jgi:zinc protease
MIFQSMISSLYSRRFSAIARLTMACVLAVHAYAVPIHAQKKKESTGKQTLDRTKKPGAGSLGAVSFPKYEQFTLSNGLRVILVEDHEQPTVFLRMQVEMGSASEEKIGATSMMASLLTKGAGKRTALDISSTLDGVGASVSAGASDDAFFVFGYALKKQLPLLLDVFSDVIIRPTFPQEEMDKLKPQALTTVKNRKSSAGALGTAMTNIALFGKDHPYARLTTEKTVEALKLDDIKSVYSRIVRPNVATLAVVGDMNKAEVVALLEKSLSDWKQSDVVKPATPAVKPMKPGVYFVERPGSVQSQVVFVSQGVPYSHPDYTKTQLIANLMGGSGFGSRLMQTLRETYSYTYTPFARVGSNRWANTIRGGAAVRNAVTDSTIIVLRREFDNLASQDTPDSIVKSTQQFVVGNYLMGFEESSFIAGLLQDAIANGIPIEKVKNYPVEYSALTPADLRSAAKQYTDINNAYIIVCGSADVLKKIEALNLGPINRYTNELEVASPYTKMTMTPEQLMKRHLDAVGGADSVAALKTLLATGDVHLAMGGQKVKGTVSMSMKSPDKATSQLKVTLPPINIQKWVNGDIVFEDQMGRMTQAEGQQADAEKFEARIFPVASLTDLGYTITILGKKDGLVWFEALSKRGEKRKIALDGETYLTHTVESTSDTPQGPASVTQTYKNYVVVNGTKLPGTIEMKNGPISVMMTLTYKANTPLDDAIFSPKK